MLLWNFEKIMYKRKSNTHYISLISALRELLFVTNEIRRKWRQKNWVPQFSMWHSYFVF